MPGFTEEFSNSHVVSSDNTNKLYSNFHSSKMINFGAQFRETAPRHNGTHRDHGGATEFRARRDDDPGVTSPPLWHTSPPTTDTSPLQSHVYNHHHYNSRSPTPRSHAIAQGKEELMEMVNNMPESFYELSLKDLVEHSKLTGIAKTTVSVFEERKPIKDYYTTKSGRKKNMALRKKQISRSGSKSRPVLLKMFVPTLGLGNNKSSKKVSPKPVEGDKFGDKDWRKKVLPDIGKTNGSCSSTGSSGSSNRSRSKNGPVPTLGLGYKKSSIMTTFPKVSPKLVDGDKSGDMDWKKLLPDIGETYGSSSSSNKVRRNFLPSWLSFLNNKNNKTKKQKGNLL